MNYNIIYIFNMAEETSDEVATYLGQKGYSIFKENISVEEQHWLREQLTVKPYIPKSPVQPPAFHIYRESPKKLYIPRFFGFDNYGEPDESRIPDGTSVNINFNGSLRDYQQNVVNTYISKIGPMGGGGLLELPCGYGKTIIALNIIGTLKLKTLVIVHKSFLMNQWIERIEQFLPDARIGKIQGQIIDIEDKDIVIGMLQSLSTKTYPSGIFDSFGLTIVDECHHISSEVFSRSLLSIVTKHMLGLSATMNRKDGLTKVFKMFLGEIVFSVKRDTDDFVLVKSITYNTNDHDFNEQITDYRGNVAYSSMIVKLCDYVPRSEFIITVLETELKEKDDQQIMILAHNKSLLTYLYKAIEERNIASVGYYIGGMKEEALKQSENKKVIIATYSMASEALDIKTLSTLIMATPKTDIEQAVGRILRVKHERPLVVDIVDSHEVYERQWCKRKKFYIKNNYKIIKSNNVNYINNKWLDEYIPVNKKAKTKKKCGKAKEDTDSDTEQPYTPNKSIPKGKCMIKL